MDAVLISLIFNKKKITLVYCEYHARMFIIFTTDDNSKLNYNIQFYIH